MMFVAQLAGMMAASINGLASPIFVTRLKSADFQNEALKLILKNMLALNHAFDLIFLAGAWSAILLWSISIIKVKPIHPGVGYFGILMSLATLGILLVQSIEINVHTFRLFMSAYMIWTVWMGILLYRFKGTALHQRT